MSMSGWIPTRLAKAVTVGVAATAVVAVLAGCSQSAASASGSDGKIVVVGAENQYSDVAAQIGGKYVSATAIMSDPNTDPHTFEASASVAKELSTAQLVVQNGVGYDDFMTTLEKASPNDDRKVIVAQKVLGLPDSTPNPHLWYDPKTMPAVARQIAAELGTIQPDHKAYFQKNLATFTDSLKTWTDQLSTFKQSYANTPVAVTEPVADYMLQAAGVDIKTPWSLQASIMNDTDPSPQDSAAQDALFTGKQVKVFLYNQQVTDSITSHYLSLARSNDIPVVGVYETMPSGYHYQEWMEAELTALQKAITSDTSTEKL
jgi:zinc/manganese transport system substrate-binding protein